MKNLFIEGRPGIGKSTLLIKKLNNYITRAGGFRTIRLLKPEGMGNGYVGFAHVDPDSPEGIECVFHEGIERIFLRVDSGRAELNLDEFRNFVLPGLAANTAGFIFMDEVGGSELKEEDIYSAFIDVLKSGKPCIGVIKSPDHARHFAYDTYLRFRSELISTTDTGIYTMTVSNTDDTEKIIDEWISENL